MPAFVFIFIIFRFPRTLHNNSRKMSRNATSPFFCVPARRRSPWHLSLVSSETDLSYPFPSHPFLHRPFFLFWLGFFFPFSCPSFVFVSNFVSKERCVRFLDFVQSLFYWVVWVSCTLKHPWILSLSREMRSSTRSQTTGFIFVVWIIRYVHIFAKLLFICVPWLIWCF
jgi:hypothetical protein